jgi:hypothetical protein
MGHFEMGKGKKLKKKRKKWGGSEGIKKKKEIRKGINGSKK